MARVYDLDAAELMSRNQLSTSPTVTYSNTQSKTVNIDGDAVLVEDEPLLLDHVAVCEVGVWDKLLTPAGVITNELVEGEKMDKNELKEQVRDVLADSQSKADYYVSKPPGNGLVRELADSCGSTRSKSDDYKSNEEFTREVRDGSAFARAGNGEDVERDARARVYADEQSERDREDERRGEHHRSGKYHQTEHDRKDESKGMKDKSDSEYRQDKRDREDERRGEHRAEGKYRQSEHDRRDESRIMRRKDHSDADYRQNERDREDERRAMEGRHFSDAQDEKDREDERRGEHRAEGKYRQNERDRNDERRGEDRYRREHDDDDGWKRQDAKDRRDESRGERDRSDSEKYHQTERDRRDERRGEERRSHSDESFLRREIEDIRRRLPDEIDDRERDELSDAQVKADSAFAAQGKRAPSPLAGERATSYRRRCLMQLQSCSPDYRKVDLTTISDSQMLAIAEKQIFADAMKFADDHVPDGSLREVKKTDMTGRTISTFIGDPAACWAPFKLHSRQILSIGTNH